MYIVDYDEQIALINEMKQLRKDPQKYEVYYHHPVTNQMWKSLFPWADGKSLGPKLLRHEPLPANIEDQLDICLSEDVPENAIGLGIEWAARPELWPTIIEILENRYSQYDRTQLKRFLDNLHMDQSPTGLPVKEERDDQLSEISADLIDDLIWRSRKIRIKRFFVLG